MKRILGVIVGRRRKKEEEEQGERLSRLDMKCSLISRDEVVKWTRFASKVGVTPR